MVVNISSWKYIKGCFASRDQSYMGHCQMFITCIYVRYVYQLFPGGVVNQVYYNVHIAT